jgi:hypothetical protein
MQVFRRMFRRPDFYKMRKEKDVEGLMEIFNDPKRSPNEDSEVRDTLSSIVYDCIKEKDLKTIRKIYRTAKTHKIGSAHLRAINGLGELGDKESVESLIDEIQNPLFSLSSVASATALGKIGDERAIKPLIDVFSIEYYEHVTHLPRYFNPMASGGTEITYSGGKEIRQDAPSLFNAAETALCAFNQRAIESLVEAQECAEKSGDLSMSAFIKNILSKIQK